MKRLPLFRRPYFARSVLEIGGGHAPYSGVTHAVDKFPADNSQRAGNLRIESGVVFRQGDLEAIPFCPPLSSEPVFDFLYASHVFEHVQNPEKAVSEINRVARRGYLATPSPLREQVSCPYPFDAKTDFHTLFCWTHPNSDRIHVIVKTPERIGEFCGCENGKLARYLFGLKRNLGHDMEPLMPGTGKETAVYFKAPLLISLHSDFPSACKSGVCAYWSAHEVKKWGSFPLHLLFSRFQELHRLLRPWREQ